MSHSSEISSGTSISRQRGKVIGVSKMCWCGAQITAKMSKSEANPYRRYYRCAFAASHKLADDNHTFKWVDDALIDEVEKLASQMKTVEENISLIGKQNMEEQKLVFEKLHIQMVKEMTDRVEDALLEANKSMQKMMFVIVLCGISVFVMGKVLG